MKLVNATTGTEIKVGDKVRTRNGDAATVSGLSPPHRAGSVGRVYVDIDLGCGQTQSAGYFPFVINARYEP